MGQWTEPPEKRQSKFVFIGKNLDREQLQSGFAACVHKPLRFAVGDKVKAKVRGGWIEGEVSMHWDQGKPYRIKLSDGREVHGPVDDDRVVVAA